MLTRFHWSLYLLALLFAAAGILHFVSPQFYLRIMPPWLPAPLLLVQLSGVAELAGGLGLLLPATRRLAGWGLLALLVAVFRPTCTPCSCTRPLGGPGRACRCSHCSCGGCGG